MAKLLIEVVGAGGGNRLLESIDATLTRIERRFVSLDRLGRRQNETLGTQNRTINQQSTATDRLSRTFVTINRHSERTTVHLGRARSETTNWLRVLDRVGRRVTTLTNQFGRIGARGAGGALGGVTSSVSDAFSGLLGGGGLGGLAGGAVRAPFAAGKLGLDIGGKFTSSLSRAIQEGGGAVGSALSNVPVLGWILGPLVSGGSAALGIGGAAAGSVLQGAGGLLGAAGELGGNIAEGLIGGFTKTLLVGGALSANAIRQGLGFVAAERAFTRFVPGVESAEAALKRYREVTRGTIDDTELLRQSTRAFATGAVENQRELELLLEGADRLAQFTRSGTSSEALERLTIGITTRSRRLIDDLTIVTSVSDANRNYAEILGKTTEELTEQERILAFRIAVFDALEDRMTTLGPATEAVDVKSRGFFVTLENISKTFGTVLLPAYERGIDLLRPYVVASEDWLKTNKLIIESGIDEFLDSIPSLFERGANAADRLVSRFAEFLGFDYQGAKRDIAELFGIGEVGQDRRQQQAIAQLVASPRGELQAIGQLRAAQRRSATILSTVTSTSPSSIARGNGPSLESPESVGLIDRISRRGLDFIDEAGDVLVEKFSSDDLKKNVRELGGELAAGALEGLKSGATNAAVGAIRGAAGSRLLDGAAIGSPILRGAQIGSRIASGGISIASSETPIRDAGVVGAKAALKLFETFASPSSLLRADRLALGPLLAGTTTKGAENRFTPQGAQNRARDILGQGASLDRLVFVLERISDGLEDGTVDSDKNFDRAVRRFSVEFDREVVKPLKESAAERLRVEGEALRSRERSIEEEVRVRERLTESIGDVGGRLTGELFAITAQFVQARSELNLRFREEQRQAPRGVLDRFTGAVDLPGVSLNARAALQRPERQRRRELANDINQTLGSVGFSQLQGFDPSGPADGFFGAQGRSGFGFDRGALGGFGSVGLDLSGDTSLETTVALQEALEASQSLINERTAITQRALEDLSVLEKERADAELRAQEETTKALKGLAALMESSVARDAEFTAELAAINKRIEKAERDRERARKLGARR